MNRSRSPRRDAAGFLLRPAPRYHGRMVRRFRRFEILLPLVHNDGRPVPPPLIDATLGELREQSGAVSSETQTIRGDWRFGEHVYEDKMMRVFVDVEDTPDNFAYFANLKPTLRQRFEQLDLYMTTYPIEVL